MGSKAAGPAVIAAVVDVVQASNIGCTVMFLILCRWLAPDYWEYGVATLINPTCFFSFLLLFFLVGAAGVFGWRDVLPSHSLFLNIDLCGNLKVTLSKSTCLHGVSITVLKCLGWQTFLVMDFYIVYIYVRMK